MVKIGTVDDEPLVLVTLRPDIEGIDGAYLVAGEFSNGKDAMDYISRQSDVDIVITDVDMPVMDGLSLAKMLSDKRQSVLFLSAYSSFNYARNAYRLGSEDYVLKNEMDSRSVRATLNAIVEKRRNAELTNDNSTSDSTIDSTMLMATKFLRMASLGNSNAEELTAAFDGCGFKVKFPLCFAPDRIEYLCTVIFGCEFFAQGWRHSGERGAVCGGVQKCL